MRKFVCAAVVTVFAFTVAMADETFVTIRKIDGDKITATKKAKKGEKGEEVTLNIKGAKVVTAKFNKDTKKLEPGDALAGGVNALKERLDKAGDKGVGAVVVHEGDKVSEIRVLGKKGGKKKDGN